METSPALLCRQLRQLQLQLCQLLLMPVPVIHARMVALAFRMIKDIGEKKNTAFQIKPKIPVMFMGLPTERSVAEGRAWF
jgi:hypothetical protein